MRDGRNDLDSLKQETGRPAPNEHAKGEPREPNRRDLLQAGGLLAALPFAGGLGASAMAGFAPTRALAASPGQCVLGVTQEAVNFNPLLYVNTGVETSVEFIVFDKHAGATA